MERNEDRTMKGISVKLFFRTSSVPQKTQQSVRSYVMRQIVRLEQNGRSIINETYLSVYKSSFFESLLVALPGKIGSVDIFRGKPQY